MLFIRYAPRAYCKPFEYVPTTFLLRGQFPSGTSRLLFCTGVRPLRIRPDYFSAQGAVPFGYVPTTFQHRGRSPSGTSRLLFRTGGRPLRVRPDYFSAQGSVPFGYAPTTFSCTMQTVGQNTPHLANPPGNTPHILQVQ
ncbi:hypothetical protein CDL15_Pgr021071 [Punica granatum]|uniref:Uncharacterized protein n=1 Tax=Punica granatum TaxID=22663 RepID=A0A218WRC6_PUNGR|nr:hypothetical protein CDL15_Pgr021071 [Punica granatum]